MHWDLLRTKLVFREGHAAVDNAPLIGWPRCWKSPRITSMCSRTKLGFWPRARSSPPRQSPTSSPCCAPMLLWKPEIIRGMLITGSRRHHASHRPACFAATHLPRRRRRAVAVVEAGDHRGSIHHRLETPPHFAQSRLFCRCSPPAPPPPPPRACGSGGSGNACVGPGAGAGNCIGKWGMRVG